MYRGEGDAGGQLQDHAVQTRSLLIPPAPSILLLLLLSACTFPSNTTRSSSDSVTHKNNCAASETLHILENRMQARFLFTILSGNTGAAEIDETLGNANTAIGTRIRSRTAMLCICIAIPSAFLWSPTPRLSVL